MILSWFKYLTLTSTVYPIYLAEVDYTSLESLFILPAKRLFVKKDRLVCDRSLLIDRK